MNALARLPARPPSKRKQLGRRGGKPANDRRHDFPIFIAHADVAAGRHAMTRLSGWLEQTRPEYRLVPMLWRFDQLGDPRWQKMATPDLARASTLVIALKKDSGPGPELEAWLTLITKRARGRTVSAMVMIDGEDAWTVSLQHIVPKTTSTPTVVAAGQENSRDETILEPAGIA